MKKNGKKWKKMEKNGKNRVFFHLLFSFNLLIICLFFRIKLSKAVFSRSFSIKCRFFLTSSLLDIETLRLCNKLLSFFIELVLCEFFIVILFDSLIILDESFTKIDIFIIKILFIEEKTVYQQAMFRF